MNLEDITPWYDSQREQFEAYGKDDESLLDQLEDLWENEVDLQGEIIEITERLEPSDVIDILKKASTSDNVLYTDTGEGYILWFMYKRELQKHVTEAFRQARKLR